MGNLLREREDLVSAQSYLENALALIEQGLGVEHPDSAIILSSLGLLRQKQGNRDWAKLDFEKALRIRRRVLGDEHPSTAISLYNLGLLLQAQGDLNNAGSHIEKALAIVEQRLGADHPNTIRIRQNLTLLRDKTSIAKFFKPFYEHVKELENELALKDVIRERIQIIEEEASKGPQANEKVVENAFIVFDRMIKRPDISEDLAMTLASPDLELPEMIQEMAQHIER